MHPPANTKRVSYGYVIKININQSSVHDPCPTYKTSTTSHPWISSHLIRSINRSTQLRWAASDLDRWR